MKTKVLFSTIFALLYSAFLSINAMAADNNAKAGGSVTVASTADLYQLSTTWVAEYQKQHPGQLVNIIRYTSDDKPGILQTGANLFFVTDGFYTSLPDDKLWKMVVGRDAIVPVISSKNPLLAKIERHGISQQMLTRLLTDPGNQPWDKLADNTPIGSVNVYILNDGSLKLRLAKFLNSDAGKLHGSSASSGEELVSLIEKDPNAIGFCSLSDVLSPDKKSLLPGISLLPIDKNGNGLIDNFENIYTSLPDFLRGVWLGKYPGALTSSIYAVAAMQPEDESQLAFMRWVLDGGQLYLNPNGYFDLGYSEREAKLALLGNNLNLAQVPVKITPFQTAMIILLVIVIAGSIAAYALGVRRNKKAIHGKGDHRAPRVDAGSINAPRGLWFDKSHTWAFMEQNGMVRVGIDDFLQHITGPLSRIMMKNPGEQVVKGDKILTLIQHGKQLVICSPVSGTIRSQNGLLNSHTTLLNTAPFTDGWVYTIEPTNWLRETQFLFMAEKYTAWLKQEFCRLREFFATSVMAHQGSYMPIVLQDGGEVQDNVLSGFGPEVWEEFQEKFVDGNR